MNVLNIYDSIFHLKGPTPVSITRSPDSIRANRIIILLKHE